MEQDPEQVGKDDDKASVDGASSLDFNFLDEAETESVAGTTGSAEDETSTLELPSTL